MTNRERLAKGSNKQLARFLIRYCSCVVCVCHDTCPHHPDNLRKFKPEDHRDDQTCADRIERWLGEEFTGGKL